ncbi:hypothetical protein HK101_002710, partial [Irineochytrium annulatum]
MALPHLKSPKTGLESFGSLRRVSVHSAESAELFQRSSVAYQQQQQQQAGVAGSEVKKDSFASLGAGSSSANSLRRFSASGDVSKPINSTNSVSSARGDREYIAEPSNSNNSVSNNSNNLNATPGLKSIHSPGASSNSLRSHYMHRGSTSTDLSGNSGSAGSSHASMHGGSAGR